VIEEYASVDSFIRGNPLYLTPALLGTLSTLEQRVIIYSLRILRCRICTYY